MLPMTEREVSARPALARVCFPRRRDSFPMISFPIFMRIRPATSTARASSRRLTIWGIRFSQSPAVSAAVLTVSLRSVATCSPTPGTGVAFALAAAIPMASIMLIPPIV